ncbi:MAG: type II secretion system F family protein [Erysipelotrichaceae bacterium]|nr:type II secretion system F family protein [Erysipelotrichaceae bacterium]
MKESLKAKFTEKKLSIEDISYLSKLLETNLSLNECFELLSNRKNEKIFKEIRKKLDEGNLIEEIISTYLPKDIKPYVVSLLNTLSLEAALSLSLKFHELHEENKSSLLSSIAYPLILLFISMTSLYLFDLYGIDSIFALIGSFDADINLYGDIRIVFRITITVFYYLTLIMFLLLVIYSRPRKIVMLYIFLSKYFPNSLLNIYYSEEFMSLLLICAERGYKTREALGILKNMKSKPVVSFLAFHMDESLLEGETLKEAAKKRYYDSSLSRFIKIANFTNNFSGVIRSYTQLANEKIRRRMKRYTLTIQLATYVFIGSIIIFIYQILFMPMRAISFY